MDWNKWLILVSLGLIIAGGAHVMKTAVYENEKHEVPLPYFFLSWLILIFCWGGFCYIL